MGGIFYRSKLIIQNMNWYLIIFFGAFTMALIVFLIMRNRKDEIDFEEKINDDYTKSKHDHVDTN